MAPSIYFDAAAPMAEFIQAMTESLEDHSNDTKKQASDAEDHATKTGKDNDECRRNCHGRDGPDAFGPRERRCNRGRHGFGPRGGHGPWGRHGSGHQGPAPWMGAWGHPWFRPEPSANDELKPSVDVFESDVAYTVHVALPGALKEDIGIHYDVDKGQLQVSGLVHRPGDEEFLKTLVSSERAIGAFERVIKLEGEVEADDIAAKLENGLLEVVVPKKAKAPVPEKKKIEIE